MKNKILIALLALFIFSCSSDTETPEPTDPPMQGEDDTTAPTINIAGLEDLIEVLTTIEITVNDASENVNTEILINGEGVFSTMEKTFSYALDPFDFPAGETTITVQATDDNDNQGMETQTFELKKLVARIAAPIFSNDLESILFSVNTLTGQLVSTTPVERPFQIVSLYAEDGFERQEFTITQYVLPESSLFSRFISRSNIVPGTDLVTTQENFNIPTENTATVNRLDSSLTLTITDVPDENLASALVARGFGYLGLFPMVEPGNVGSDAILNIQNNPSLSEGLTIFSANYIDSSGASAEVQDFRYLVLDDLMDQSIPFSEFKAPSGFETIELPNNTDFYRTTLFGYNDQEALENNTFRTLFDFVFPSNNGNAMVNSAEIPIIDEFDLFRVKTDIRFDDFTRLSAFRTDFSDIVVPDWQAVRENDVVIANGNYELYNLSLSLFSDDNSANLSWGYQGAPQNSIPIPFETFELPDEVLNNSAVQRINLTNLNGDQSLFIGLLGVSEEVPYEALLFAIQNFPLYGNIDTLSFPLNR